jgi:hypothetical protein
MENRTTGRQDGKAGWQEEGGRRGGEKEGGRTGGQEGRSLGTYSDGHHFVSSGYLRDDKSDFDQNHGEQIKENDVHP